MLTLQRPSMKLLKIHNVQKLDSVDQQNLCIQDDFGTQIQNYCVCRE